MYSQRPGSTKEHDTGTGRSRQARPAGFALVCTAQRHNGVMNKCSVSNRTIAAAAAPVDWDGSDRDQPCKCIQCGSHLGT